MINLARRETFHGPNPYSGEPVVVADIMISDEIAARTDAIIADIRNLCSVWLKEDDASTGGDASEKLVDFLLHWSISALNWMHGCLEARGFRKTAEGFRVWIAFHDAGITYSALMLAIRLANAVGRGRADSDDLNVMLDKLWDACLQRHPDSSDEIVMRGARELDIPFSQGWNTLQLWQFGWGARSEMISSASSDRDGYVSGKIIAQKNRTKNALRSLGLPVPPGVLIRSEEEVERAVEQVGFPCVVKPINLGKGMGISANLATLEEVRSAFRYARTLSDSPIMVEAFVKGDDYRLLIAGGELQAVVRRIPPAVTGNGKSTIRELTEELNQGRVHPDNLSLDLLPAVRLDERAIEHLESQGVTPETVLTHGRKVTLRSIANISTGGSTEDVTGRIHPDIRTACEMIARTFQVNMAGFDYITTDISKNWRDVPGAFIELNLTPALIGFTLIGRSPTEVSKLMLSDQTGRIPLDVIVMPSDLLAAAEERFARGEAVAGKGWASHDKAQIGNLPLVVQSIHPWSGVRTILRHRSVEHAFVLATGTHLQRHGLPVDRADRIWNCDPELPEEWIEVLRTASATPLRSGQWRELGDTILAEVSADHPPG